MLLRKPKCQAVVAHMLRRQRPVDCCELKAHLAYTVSSRIARVYTGKPPSGK